MLKRLATAFALFSTGGLATAQQAIRIGNYQLTSPAGWQQIKTTQDKIVLGAPDGRQQTTLTIVDFAPDAPLEASARVFTKLCERRLAAEKSDLADVFLTPDHPEPVKEGNTFSFMYSGGEKSTKRVFSGYLQLTGRELLTVYVEGIGIPGKEHLESFRSFVASVKPR